MIRIGEVINNQTLCDMFGVANTGGIRVNTSRNMIVLVSNNTDPTYKNEWDDDVLKFVGRGSAGVQNLDRQNRTLSKSSVNGAEVHLFEVFAKGRYTYAGVVELVADPYRDDQEDQRGDDRLVWIFPMKRSTAPTVRNTGTEDGAQGLTHLPAGSYAVIGSKIAESNLAEVNRLLDKIRALGVNVLDQRDVDNNRYGRALGNWHEGVLKNARSAVRGIIKRAKSNAKSRGKSFGFSPDEIELDQNADENHIRSVLDIIGYGDEFDQLMQLARDAVPMPNPPTSMETSIGDEADVELLKKKTFNFDKFKDVT